MDSTRYTLLLITGGGGDLRRIQEMLAQAKEAHFNLVWTDRLELGARHLAAGPVDAVLVEAGAADADGWDHLLRLQRLAPWAPILVVSGASGNGRLRQAVRHGADDVLVRDCLNADMLERVLHTAIERKRFRERQLQGRLNLTALITKNADAIVVVGPAGSIRFANPAAETLFHRPLEELIGAPFGFPITVSENAELDILSGNGDRKVAEMRVVDFDWNGEGVFLASLRDVSERKRVEDRLRCYQRIVNASSDIMVLIDRHRTCREVNDAFRRCYVLGPSEAIGRPSEELFGEAVFAEHFKPGLDRSLAGEVVHHQCWLEMGAAGQRFVHIAFYPYADADHSISGAILSMRDLTDTKSLEARLYQSQKMEAIGTLAGGVAHDFNNLLMGIQGYAALMMLNADRDHPFYTDLQGINELVGRASDLTRQLLGFARGGKYDVVPADLNALTRKTLEMFGRTRREIEFECTCAPDLWTAEVDQNQIGQVLLNLFVNAWQAMPDGGRLSVRTENVTLAEPAAAGRGVAPGRYVRIDVTDTGTGMDVATRQRIFDPFFTTKGPGGGTGLGLASAYGIVRNHHGCIDVTSRVGRGSTFSVYLPASDKAPSPAPTGIDALPRGRERILLVDDEEVIRSVGRKLLETIGYTVVTAAAGREALDRFALEPDGFDLVILDMVMPGMGGGETFDRLRAIRPEVKVLLASGYSMEGQAARILQRGCNGFIQKPFGLDALAKKLRELLE